MSSNVQYRKDKVEKFIAMYNNYTSMVSDYKNYMGRVNSTFKSVINNYNNAYDNDTVKIYENDDGSGRKYILTPEKVLMEIDSSIAGTLTGTSITLPDSSLNSLVLIGGESVFYTDVKYEGHIDSNTGKSNQFVQMGLADLSYNQGTPEPYEFNESKTPVLTRTMNWGESCTDEDINRCDAYAKFTNTPYYGLGHNSGQGDTGNSCDCYMLSSDERDKLTLIEEKVVLLNTNMSTMDNMKYLGVMLDGNIHGLKELVYNNNFDNFYEKNNNKITTLTNKPRDGNCHPFTGTGVNSIKINNLGEKACVLNTS